MHKFIKTLFVLSIFSFAVMSYAQESLKLGHIDVREVFNNYEKAREKEAEFMKEASNEISKVQRMESEIKEMKENLDNRKDIITAAEKTRREQELFQKVQQYTALAGQVKQSLEKKGQELENSLMALINESIKEYAQKEGYAMIFDSRILLYGSETVDLTQPIINKLNKE